MVNIILAGAGGRMGRAILNLLPNFKGLKPVGAVDAEGNPSIGKKVLDVTISSDLSKIIGKCDVVVDFTSAEASIKNLSMAFDARKAIVIGATGLNKSEMAELKKASERIPVVYSPNMSVGVNVMWEIIKRASDLLGKKYQIDIVETHHVHKKDSPSGTAKKMIELVASDQPVRVKSLREGEVVGEHTIIFSSPYEKLEITHRALSREVFAAGALKAAEWIVGRPAGLYNMKDVIECNH